MSNTTMKHPVLTNEIPQTQVPFSIEKLWDVLADRAAGNWPASAHNLDTRLALELKHPEWIAYLMGPSGKLEPTFAKTGSHGRTYSSKPNVQGYTRPLRPIFSVPGKLILRVDYGASHLRILANRSNDPTLLADCAAGDPYVVPTQALIDLGVPAEGARDVAKPLMLSILNGMGAKTIGTRIEAAGGEANKGAEFLAQVDEHWPVVAEWINNLKNEVVEAGWKIPRQGTSDISIPADDRDEYRIPAYYLQGHEAAALDRVLQAADFFKEEVPSLELIMPLHDETVWAVSPSEARQAAHLISSVMVQELFGEPIGPSDTDATLDPTMRERATKLADLTDEALAAMATEVEAVPQTLTRREHIEEAIANLVLVGEHDEEATVAFAQNKTARFQLLLAEIHNPDLVEAELASIEITCGRALARSIKAIIKPAKAIKSWLDRVSAQEHSPFEESVALIHRVPGPLQRVVAKLKTDTHGTPRPTQNNVREILRTDPLYAGGIWRNELDGSTYIGTERLSGDTAIQKLRRYLADTYDLDVYASLCHEGVEEEATHNRRDPLVEMLDSYAAKADGTEEILDNWLEKSFPHASKGPLLRAYARKFILGMVGRAYNPGTKFDTCLTLVGEQGALKSTFVKTLAGTILGGEPLSGESHLNFAVDNKTVLEMMSGAWVYELPEVEKYGAKEQGIIKNFLSVQTDEFRAAYARRAHRTPRRTVFIATTNTEEFLVDTTGSRRYWVVSTGGAADIGWLRENREELLGVAANYYKKHKGEPFLTYLTPEEDGLRNTANLEEFTEISPLVEQIIQVFKGSRTIDHSSFTRIELLERLEIKPSDTQAKWPLKRALEQLGCTQRKNAVKHNGGRKRTYRLDESSPYYTEIASQGGITSFIASTRGAIDELAMPSPITSKPQTPADLPVTAELPLNEEIPDAEPDAKAELEATPAGSVDLATELDAGQGGGEADAEGSEQAEVVDAPEEVKRPRRRKKGTPEEEKARRTNRPRRKLPTRKVN